MKKLDATGNKDIDYFVYSKDGSVFGYGSKFSLIPELQLSEFDHGLMFDFIMDFRGTYNKGFLNFFLFYF